MTVDIVTVVFRDELQILRVQAESIKRYCDPSTVANIIVVVNDTEDVDLAIDKNWWGSFSSCVNIINRSSLGNTWQDNGWVTQQVLKITGSATSSSRWSVVLDAKTILLKDITDGLFDSTGRVRSGSLKIYEVFHHSRDIVNNLLGISLDYQIGPGGVPFVFCNSIIRDMIQYIEQQTDCDFSDWFQQQGRLTEFILYTGFVVHSGQTALYNLSDSALRPVNICHSETGIWDIKIDQMKTTDPSTVSVHRNAWNKLTATQQQQYRDILISKDILSIGSI
jgi:hypothetical protein